MNTASGKRSKAMCARCGRKVPYTDLRQEWTGLWVCQIYDCYDPKQPQLEPRKNVVDPQALDHPYVDNDDDGTVAQQLEDVIDMTFGAT